MIKSIEFIRDLGNEQKAVKNIKLGAPETSGLWVKSIKGIGPGKASINTTDMASSDGGIYNSARAQVRNITLTLGILDYTDSDGNYHSVEDVRRDTYKIFGKKNEVQVRVHTDYGVEKDGDGEFILYTFGYIESCEPDIFNKQETMAISIICPNPNFYSETGYETIDFSGTDSIFEFPIDYTVTEDEAFTQLGYYETLDAVRVSGKTYYEYDESTQTYTVSTDDPFVSGKTYYELDFNSNGQSYYEKALDNQYYQTTDEAPEPGTTYYTGGLYNEVGSPDEYVETTDETFAVGKEYYEADPNNLGQYMLTSDWELGYVLTSDTTKTPGKTYYELNSNLKMVASTDATLLAYKKYYEKVSKTYYEYNNDIIFANIQVIPEQVIDYYGEIEVGVTIKLKFNDIATGVRIFKIIDDNNYEEMAIDDTALEAAGGTISPGDEITICTVKGQKYAELNRNASYTNIMNALGRNPSWFQLNYGRNIFSYSADTGQEFIDVSISYDEAYEGI